MKNQLNPYFSNRSSNYDFHPNDTVFVPSIEFSYGDGNIKLLGSTAYRTAEDSVHDLWSKNPNLKMKQMTVKQFLKSRLNKHNSVNEFHKLKEFKERYEEKYGIKIEVKNDPE